MADEQLKQSEVASAVAAETPAGRMTGIGRTLHSVVEVGRELLARRRASTPDVQVAPLDSAAVLAERCQALLRHRGEASGLALACEIVHGYQQLPEMERLPFFLRLAGDFEVDRDTLLAAMERYRENGELENLRALSRAIEAPRLKLFRRLNTAPEGTRTLVTMRGHLLRELRANPQLRGVDADLKQLFISWFNKGFLQMRRIDWSSPASVLEKIIAYEAVHEINGWEDLRSRLHEDRRCFAFFHPALEDEPLVFVEIALTTEVPDALAPLLQEERAVPDEPFNTVVFYSISNCQAGLHQVSFGNFLIKSVVEELRKEMSSLANFVTLSPVPGFRKWLLGANIESLVPHHLRERVREPLGKVVDAEVYGALLRLCAHYLCNEKSGRLPRDSVARFHLGNGASLHRLNGSANMSEKGREQAAGIMVNYLYDLPAIEANHDAYFDQGEIAMSRAVRRLLG